MKDNLTSAPVLAYFDLEKELILQVDSSKDGLGAVLMQQGRPIEYASRALTSSERKWAQIEKEVLPVLFSVQRFDQYTYGRQVTVENDHKPLESILRKPLSNAPKRLQDIMMKLNRYDIVFKFLKGKELVIAGTLSRAYINEKTETRLDIFMVQVSSDLNYSRLQEIREAPGKDPDLPELIDTIKSGWPDHKCSVKDSCKPYFDTSIRDNLIVYEGIVVKGKPIVIYAEESQRICLLARNES